MDNVRTLIINEKTSTLKAQDGSILEELDTTKLTAKGSILIADQFSCKKLFIHIETPLKVCGGAGTEIYANVAGSYAIAFLAERYKSRWIRLLDQVNSNNDLNSPIAHATVPNSTAVAASINSIAYSYTGSRALAIEKGSKAIATELGSLAISFATGAEAHGLNGGKTRNHAFLGSILKFLIE